MGDSPAPRPDFYDSIFEWIGTLGLEQSQRLWIFVQIYNEEIKELPFDVEGTALQYAYKYFKSDECPLLRLPREWAQKVEEREQTLVLNKRDWLQERAKGERP